MGLATESVLWKEPRTDTLCCEGLPDTTQRAPDRRICRHSSCFVRATKDIDLLVDASIENIQRLNRGMSVLPDNAIALISDDEVERYQSSESPMRSSSTC